MKQSNICRPFYDVLPTTFQVFLKSSVSMTKYPSMTPGRCALNLTMNIVSSFCRRDPSDGAIVNSDGVPATKAARKSANPMNGFCKVRKTGRWQKRKCRANIDYEMDEMEQSAAQTVFFHGILRIYAPSIQIHTRSLVHSFDQTIQ